MTQNAHYGAQGFGRPADILKAISNRAVEVRKLLSSIGKRVDRRTWCLLRDAVRLSRTIEALARRSDDLPAADAMALVEILEVLQDELDTKVHQILAR